LKLDFEPLARIESADGALFLNREISSWRFFEKCVGGGERILHLQLQRQRCSRLERFFKVEENLLFFKTHYVGYSWRCKFLPRWRCNFRS
jgi:hypothetical protein